MCIAVIMMIKSPESLHHPNIKAELGLCDYFVVHTAGQSFIMIASLSDLHLDRFRPPGCPTLVWLPL